MTCYFEAIHFHSVIVNICQPSLSFATIKSLFQHYFHPQTTWFYKREGERKVSNCVFFIYITHVAGNWKDFAYIPTSFFDTMVKSHMNEMKVELSMHIMLILYSVIFILFQNMHIDIWTNH